MLGWIHLNALFCKEPDDAPDARLEALHAYFKQHEKRLRQRGMTLLRLWEQYSRDHEHGYHVSAFYRHHRLWKRRAKPSMHMEHRAGDKMFVDYTGVRLKVVDPETGVITAVEVFVAILGASQLTYVEATASQRAVDFITCCENALHYFGGAPQAIVPDNLKSAVTKSNRYEPQLNENFAAFADHYGMAVLPARAFKPKDKALVEGAVKITYNKIFASLPTEMPTSLEQLNASIQSLLIAYNSTVFKGRSYSRLDQFLEFELAVLQPLPQHRFEMRNSRVVTVMKNGHIHLQVDKHYYSVPYAYISKKVRVIYSTSNVEIFYKYELIAAHARERKAHNYTTDAAHLASQHRIHPSKYRSEVKRAV